MRATSVGVRSGLALVLCTVLALSCYTLSRKDVFEVPFQPLSAATVTALSEQHHHVQKMDIPATGSLSVYWDRGDSTRGVLIFFNGNGYGAESALRRLLVPARALGLDLIAFNYYEPGQPRPSMAEMRRIGDALYDAAAALSSPAARHIYLGGHSLGATFAFATAVDRPASGLFVAAPVTTGIAMIRHQLSYARLVSLRPDADYSQFDNLALVPNIQVPTIVFGSTGDRALPPKFTNAVYGALPNGIVKKEVILPNVAHSEYFAQEEFWREVSQFFGLPSSGPFVGYIR